MDASTQTTKSEGLSWPTTFAGLARHYLSGRRGLILLAVTVAAAGLFLSWGWLAAVGIAPILVALAPCAAMCALGLCMNKAAGNHVRAPRVLEIRQKSDSGFSKEA